jgi:hypothetical protein
MTVATAVARCTLLTLRSGICAEVVLMPFRSFRLAIVDETGTDRIMRFSFVTSASRGPPVTTIGDHPLAGSILANIWGRIVPTTSILEPLDSKFVANRRKRRWTTG